jgi:hypothetical protein
MGSVPTGKAEITSVAVLVRVPVAVRVPLPIVVEPSMKTTEPVGGAKRPTRVAVRMTDWPALAGLSDDVTVAVVEVAGLTTWLNTADVAAPKFGVTA